MIKLVAATVGLSQVGDWLAALSLFLLSSLLFMELGCGLMVERRVGERFGRVGIERFGDYWSFGGGVRG